MWSKADLELLEKKNISEKQLDEQIECFRTGFPYINVVSAATVGDGIMPLGEEDKSHYLNAWSDYLKENRLIVKFVPASGAASRMFKDLYEFQKGGENIPNKESVVEFFDQIEKFAFFDSLNSKSKRNIGKNVSELIREKSYKDIIHILLEEKGLNYGFLPKGLIQFHEYQKTVRTAMEEHLVEGALYTKNSGGKVNLHFTVSPEHISYFNKLYDRKENEYAYMFGADYNVSFSVQKPSTDTIAVDMNNEPFRTKDQLLFRPGGHGALIENLNDIESDIIFIKNIDNVLPDPLKQPTVEYKMLLGGILISLQKQIFAYQELLEKDFVPKEMITEMLNFCENKLIIRDETEDGLSKKDPVKYLKIKLNRPLRVCGMVKNEGEPGGGPYLCENSDGTISLQILESTQFDKNNPEQMDIMKGATHFNPVDLVCGLRNFKGEKYDLTQYIDKETGFISIKSKDGKELKALELPGLWNGAMSDWNTIFVEVPIETFSPVKTVNDLLRPEHQC
jgi:hypothetical protein